MSWLLDLLKKLFGGGQKKPPSKTPENKPPRTPPRAPDSAPPPAPVEDEPPAPVPPPPEPRVVPPRPAFSRSMYVDAWHTRYRDQEALEGLGAYCQAREITELHLYDLHRILNRGSGQRAHQGAIERLKTYGISRFNAAYSTVGQLEQIDGYQRRYGDFTGTILEFEWWNEEPRDFAGATTRLRAAAGLDLEVLAYCGWYDPEEVDVLVELVDVLHLHAYRPTGDDTFQYTRSRLELLVGKQLKITPIFSAEGDFMQDWLLDRGMDAAEEQYERGYRGWHHPAKEGLAQVGYNYFRATEMMAGIGRVPGGPA